MSQAGDQIITTLTDESRVLDRGSVQVTTSQVGGNPLYKGTANADITDIKAQVATPVVMAWQLRTGGSGDSNGLRTLPFVEANTDLSILLGMFYTIEQIVATGKLRVVFNVNSTSADTYTIYYIVTSTAISLDSDLLTITP